MWLMAFRKRLSGYKVREDEMVVEEEKIEEAVHYIEQFIACNPKVAIVLGSGLGESIRDFKASQSLLYRDIPYFPSATVEEHKGVFLFGTLHDVPVVFMQGRVHYYEGYSVEEVVRPIRILRMLGVEKLILTNSSGAVNEAYSPGDMVVIEDHIASFVPNPLRGRNMDTIGPRFPDMSHIYHKDMQTIIKDAAKELNIPMQSGVYLQTAGPSFESPAEIRMYRTLGADLVGMSTACEAIAARHAGMQVGGISCVSNMASGISKENLTMKEVVENADKLRDKLGALIGLCVKNIAKEV